MRIWKKLSIFILVTPFMAFCLATSAFADFPERKIEVLFPFGPGSAMAVSQVLAEGMAKELGVAMPVVATPGAAGVKAFEIGLKKPADGYMIFDGYVAPLVLQPLLGNANWRHSDFTPLYSATSNAFAVIVRKNDDRFQTLHDLIEYMKKKEGKARYTTGSSSNLPHMVLAKVLFDNKVYGRVIPYDEMEQGIKDLRSGVLDFMMSNPAFYKTNKKHVRALAVMSELKEVSEIYDGAPRLMDIGMELGMTGLAPMGWNWWLVRKETPPEIVEKLRTAMATALANKDVRQKILNLGFVPTGYTPDEYDAVAGGVGAQLQSGIDAINWVLSKQ